MDEGLHVLAAEGAPGVRIDRIAARLGLSKGSFHLHFAGADGYKHDLLAHYEALSVEALESAIAGVGDNASTRDVLGALTEMVRVDGADLYRPEPDVAVRAWARTGPGRACRPATDRQHPDRCAGPGLGPGVPDPAEARQSALLPYLLAVGAAVVVPPVEVDDCDRSRAPAPAGPHRHG